jgi:uncharacterized protein YjgD (DUF1641 family)
MKIILTEEQYKVILTENILKDILKDFNISSGLLFTFGAGMAALMGPVERLLTNSGFSLNDKEIALLLITSIAIIIKDSNASRLLDEVKEKGLVDALNGVGGFLTNIKKLINSVSSKVVGVTYSLSDILGFALLLNPVMNIVNDLISGEGLTTSNTSKLLTGASFAAVVYGLKSVMGKIKNKLNEETIPSQTAIKNICDSEKFCSAQGKITFGQLKAIVDSATNKRLYKHIGEGGFKATLRLLPWFIPQLAVAGFVTSSIRAVNKILKPALTETETYKTWWGKAVLKAFDLSEGELNLTDPLSKVFFISDGLMTMLDDKYKIKFAKHISDMASSMSDDQEVPEFFVENELRHWINDKFLLDPPLQPKTVDPIEGSSGSM